MSSPSVSDESTPVEENVQNGSAFTFDELTMNVSTKYLMFIQEVYEKYKYHPDLSGELHSEMKTLKRNMEENNEYLLYFITANYLFCLEPITDHNTDYFIYQKDKIKKNGKVVKNKVTKFIGKLSLRKLIKESEPEFIKKIFTTIHDIFMMLTVKNEDDNIVFNDDYVTFVKDNLTEEKNFSKMLMVIDNVDTIISQEPANDMEPVTNTSENSSSNNSKGKSSNSKKKNKKNNSSDPFSALAGAFGGNLLNGLESTKIAKLAKNISEKINTDDFPLLSDPSKLLSTLTTSGEDGGNNIQDLLKFVVGEVEDAFKKDGVSETELLGEAQNIMNQFKGISGFDPMTMLKNLAGNAGADEKQFENIFSK
jgi:hypothetical protein